jgi:hypothetical protein
MNTSEINRIATEYLRKLQTEARIREYTKPTQPTQPKKG